MGNCLRHESPMMWGGEDWGESPGEDLRRLGEITKKDIMCMEEKGLLIEHEAQKNHITSSTTSYYRRATTYGNYGNNTTSGTSSNTSTEVKIKISKKQLDELLGKVDVKDLSVQQVLAQLINVSKSYDESQHLRSWRPALQSIPEVN